MKNMDWNHFWTINEHCSIDSIASPESWSDISWNISLEYWLEIFKRLSTTGNILECGCGTATFSQYMVTNSYKCYAIDTSEVILKKTQEIIDKRKLYIDLKIGDIYRLPYESNTFDFVYSGGVIEYLERPHLAISEMKRVLKPGGMLAMTIVPRKFSIQTIGDIYSIIAKSLFHLFNLNFKEVLKLSRMISLELPIIHRYKSDYVEMLVNERFECINSNTTTHFPNFALPAGLKIKYIKFLYRNKSFFLKLNRNNWIMKDLLGITYSIYGIKNNSNNS